MSLFSSQIESYAKSEVAKFEAEVAKIDADHDGSADIEEAQKFFDEALTAIKSLEAKVTPAEILAALNVVFPGKFTAADLQSFEGAVANVVSGAQHLEGVVQALGIKL